MPGCFRKVTLPTVWELHVGTEPMSAVGVQDAPPGSNWKCRAKRVYPGKITNGRARGRAQESEQPGQPVKPCKDGNLPIDAPSPSVSTWALAVLAGPWPVLRTGAPAAVAGSGWEGPCQKCVSQGRALLSPLHSSQNIVLSIAVSLQRCVSGWGTGHG